MGFLSIGLPVTRPKVEEAATRFSKEVKKCVIIRCGSMGAYLVQRGGAGGKWIDAYWTPEDSIKVVDVTGAGNSFLGGLAAGLVKSGGDLEEAMFYASISASFTIEQTGLPIITRRAEETESEMWNNDYPHRRLADLRKRKGLDTLT